MSENNLRTTSAKCLRVNLDVQRYGSFAEIGAGQEVARNFFQAGKASQTIAKSMSAYDMTFSDEIYGREPGGRYVCESRVNKMLQKEFSLLVERLDAQRGANTAFFAFANTVATGTPETPRCHGWMGIRFQARPQGGYNDIVLHVRMRDRHRLQQQEALGILGVNVVEAAFYCLDRPDKFVERLAENLREGQVYIDVLKFSGDDLKAFDNRRMNLELVRRGLAEGVLFSPKGEVLNIADAFYGNALLIQRGSFRPLTRNHIDVIDKAYNQLKKDLAAAGQQGTSILSILEMVVPPGTSEQEISDYEKRLDVAGACGFPTLVTDFPLFYQLKHFIRSHSKAQMALVMDASKLGKLFDQVHYQDLDGGFLEGVGKLMGARTKIYVYPHKTDKVCMTAKLYRPEAPVDAIYDYFLKRGQITDIAGCDETAEWLHSSDVRAMMDKGDSRWEQLVPAEAIAILKKK